MDYPKWMKSNSKKDYQKWLSYLEWDEYIQQVEHDDQDIRVLLYANENPEMSFTLWNYTNIPSIDRNQVVAP